MPDPITEKEKRAALVAERKAALKLKKESLLAARETRANDRAALIEERKAAILAKRNGTTPTDTTVENTPTSTPVVLEKMSTSEKNKERQRLLKEKEAKKLKQLEAKNKAKQISSFRINRKQNGNSVRTMSDDEVYSLIAKERKEKHQAKLDKQKELSNAPNNSNDPDSSVEWQYENGDKENANSRYKIIKKGKKWDGKGLPTDEQTWENNVNGVQDKYGSYSEYYEAAEEYRNSQVTEEKVTQSRDDWSRTVPLGFDPDKFKWRAMSGRSGRYTPAEFEAQGYKKYAAGVLRRKYDELGYYGMIKWLKANGGSYMLSRSKGKSKGSKTTSGKTNWKG